MAGHSKGSGAYPEYIRDFILANYMGTGHQAMASLLNSTFRTSFTKAQIKSYYANHKLNSGLTGQFKIGSTPFNKGKKKYWIGGEETQFKKGNRPHNYKPIGSERINADGYIDIKIKDCQQPHKNWKGKHILVYESVNGPVPSGSVVIFGDGDNRNFEINNLICVTRSQLARLNQNHLIQSDADLTRTAVVITDIITAVSRKRKG